jgi:hypothetical protein
MWEMEETCDVVYHTEASVSQSIETLLACALARMWAISLTFTDSDFQSTKVQQEKGRQVTHMHTSANTYDPTAVGATARQNQETNRHRQTQSTQHDILAAAARSSPGCKGVDCRTADAGQHTEHSTVRYSPSMAFRIAWRSAAAVKCRGLGIRSAC